MDPNTLRLMMGSAEGKIVDIAIAHTTTPYISVYPWSSGFGTKYANPATLPTGTGNGVAFSPVSI